MKKIYLSSTHPLYYLCEVPPALLLALAIRLHGEAEGPLKLFPLEIALGGVIVFIALYFTRLISFTKERVRAHGLFSSRDVAPIKEGNELIFRMEKGRRVRFALFGDGGRSDYGWLTDGDTHEIHLFRCKIVGGKRAVGSVLSFFGVEEEVVRAALEQEGYACEREDYTVAVGEKDGAKEIRVRLLHIEDDEAI